MSLHEMLDPFFAGIDGIPSAIGALVWIALGLWAVGSFIIYLPLKRLFAERTELETGMKAVEERIESDMDPLESARRMDTDEVVLVAELRERLVAWAEMSYQSSGYRRVKNPRIWSLHDLQVLTEN